ncbi:MAG: AIPR family protein, partial [Pseudomonadota bacterium]
SSQAQSWIDQTGFDAEQVEWVHLNHDRIISFLRRKKAVNDSLRFAGKALVDDFEFRRVLVGKVPITEIAELFNRHNDLLLERNIRRYLGLYSNRVNLAIHQTLVDPGKRSSFYFFNNGITMICRQFRHNALQGEDWQVKLENLQIINGGQTCKTIQQTLANPDLFSQYENVYVLVRIYELAQEDEEIVRDITYATNSQNPVDLRDLRSNDDIQQRLEIGIRELGYTYKRQREEGSAGQSVVTSSTVAEAVLSIWREKPHQAKFRRGEHFGVLYNEIFKDLNAAQAMLAVLILRYVENQRKRPEFPNPPEFLPYASNYVAMLVGGLLLVRNKLTSATVSHRNYQDLIACFEEEKDELYRIAILWLKEALKSLYGDRPISLQQLSATFRRGDLLEYVARSLKRP